LEVIDPEWPKKTQRFSPALGADALALARVLGGNRIVAACWVRMNAATLPTVGRYAAIASVANGFDG
jgi:hypothetical protein